MSDIAAPLARLKDFRASFEDGQICEESLLTAAELNVLIVKLEEVGDLVAVPRMV